ncbi:MAG TPA: hypothetical protein VFJ17_12325 [Mycobacteriales bacterium]|jgi:hypothetical protein|nr:hypothetical protein [Mycobacteriales bacterium]
MRAARRRWWLTGGIAAVTALAVATPGGSAVSRPGGASGLDAYGVPHIYPAAHNPGGENETPQLVDPAGIDNANDNVGDYLRYQHQADALPAVDTSHRWVSKGPFGIDMPAGYSQSGEKFARVSGMGAAVATQPGNPDVVYIGNMGGLWKSTDAGAHWRNLTDGKLPRVAIGAIAVDPQHPQTIYVGTGISYLTLSGDANGTGVYVTHDGGGHWTRPKQDTHGYGSNALAITPTAVFYGSNRGLYRLDKSAASKGFVRVHLPTNAAGTAEDTSFLANWISDIAVKPDDSKEISVAVGFPLGRYKLPSGHIAAQGNGLYRSTDAGKTWKRVATVGLGCKSPDACTVEDPTATSDPLGRIRLAYGQAPGQQDVLWAAVSDAGLARGLQTSGLDILPAQPAGSLNKTNTTFNGLFRSDDDGINWTLKASPLTLETSENSLLSSFGALGYGIGVQGFYNLWVATDPKVADQVYLGLEEVFQSQEGADSSPTPAKFTTIERYADLCGFLLYFQNVPPTYGLSCPNDAPIVGGMSTHPDQHAAVVVPTSDGSRIYSGNDGGFFRQDSHTLSQSTNPTQVGFDNQSWHAVNTLSTTEPYHVAVKPDGELIAALQDNGSVLVQKNGHGIEVCGGDGVFVLPTPKPAVWYCSTPNAVVYVTTDDGKTIRAIPPGNPGDSGPAGATFTSPIAIDPTDPNHLVAAAQTAFESTKGENTQVTYDSVATATIAQSDWQQVFDAGSTPRKNPTSGATYNWSATALGVRGPVVYDAVCGACRGAFTPSKLLVSTLATNVKTGCKPAKASTKCWHLAKGIGLPHGWISSVVIDPKDTKTVYVAIGQENLFEYDTKDTGSAKVLVSHDGGDHFTDVTGNLPRTEVRGMVLRAGRLIVGSDVGVFQDAAGDGKWARLGAALPRGVVVRDIYLDPTGRYLVAAPYGRGAWMLDFGGKAASSNGPGAGGSPIAGGAGGAGGSLSDTGGSPLVPIAAVVLLAVAAALHRRRRA